MYRRTKRERKREKEREREREGQCGGTIRLFVHLIYLVYLLDTFDGWIAIVPMFLHTDGDYPNQSGVVSVLIDIFAVCTNFDRLVRIKAVLHASVY